MDNMDDEAQVWCTTQELCRATDCGDVATIRCGTWSFCTKHAILADVTLDENGCGEGFFGSAYAFGPDEEDVTATIRESQVELKVKPIFHQPDAWGST